MFDRLSIARAPKAPVILAVHSDDKSLAKADRNASRDAAVRSDTSRWVRAEGGCACRAALDARRGGAWFALLALWWGASVRRRRRLDV